MEEKRSLGLGLNGYVAGYAMVRAGLRRHHEQNKKPRHREAAQLDTAKPRGAAFMIDGACTSLVGPN
jgi:hypothetical protein